MIEHSAVASRSNLRAAERSAVRPSRDCTFVVGVRQNQQCFVCPRMQLAQASPVMAAMLFGSFAETRAHVVLVPDVTPAAFTAMLQFMHTGRVDIAGFEAASELLYAAKKYLLPETLVAQCRALLWRELYPNNVWRALHFASYNDEEELYDTAWQIIVMRTSEALLLPDLEKVSEDTMLDLLTEERLGCSELELYEACVRWGQARSSHEELRECINVLLFHVRFLAMSHQDFVQGPGTSDILSPEEKLEILLYKIDCDRVSIPDGFCDNEKVRDSHNYNSFFVYGAADITSLNCTDDIAKLKVKNSYSIFSCFDFQSHGNNTIVLPTQLHEGKRQTDDIYEEDLTLILLKKSDNTLLTSTRFTERVKYNSKIEVPYKNFSLAEPIDTLLSCIVVFHKTGQYPLYLSPEPEREATVRFAFNGSQNMYVESTFEKKFTISHFLFHQLYCISTTLLAWSNALLTV